MPEVDAVRDLRDFPAPHRVHSYRTTNPVWNNRFKPSKRDLDELRSLLFSWQRFGYLLASSQQWKRFGIALLAGVTTLLPMIIIVLAIPDQRDLSQWRNVVVVCAAVFFFAGIVAWVSTVSTHQELMVAVASYAAVLVVFIGTQNLSPAGVSVGRGNGGA
jgi:hypothetical protein